MNNDDAPFFSKTYWFAACIIILLGILGLFSVYSEEAPQQKPVANFADQPREKMSPAPPGARPPSSFQDMHAAEISSETEAPSAAPPSSSLVEQEPQEPVNDHEQARAGAEEPSAQPAEAAENRENIEDAPQPEQGSASQEDETLTQTEDGAKEIISGTVVQGDTAAKLLGSAVHDIMQASRKYYSLANIRSGQPYTLVRDRETKVLERFEYEIDAHRKLVVENDGDSFMSRVESIVYDVQLALLQGTVESSLFQSVAAMGESPSLAVVVADVFRWDIDFIRDVQDGDSFSILVEKRSRGGQFKNYGRVLGATFTNKGKLFEAFLFRGVSGNESHYNAKGESLRKVLLKAPLAFTRITSGYSRGRLHPIFHDVRPHEGVDYAAPTGTPIKAVGDGVVSQKGWLGGYGNSISIRHGAGLESQYAHMSGYARGMAAGVRVRQGQVIGFVGMTGWATGPHLDFRLKQNGRFINPTKAINPREESIAPGRMKAFEEYKIRIRNFISGVTPLYLYIPGAFQ